MCTPVPLAPVGAMNKSERKLVAAAIQRRAILAGHVTRVLEDRAKFASTLSTAKRDVGAATVALRSGNLTRWTVIPTGVAVDALARALTAELHQPPLAPEVRLLMDQVVGEGMRDAETAEAALGMGRIFRGRHQREAAAGAGTRLTAMVRAWDEADLDTHLRILDQPLPSTHAPAGAALLKRSTPLGAHLHTLGTDPQLVDSPRWADLPNILTTLQGASARIDGYRRSALAAGVDSRRNHADALVAQMDVERLKEASNGRLNISALRDAAINTVADVLARRSHLTTLPGVGATTAARMVAAANTLAVTVHDETPVRIDVSNRTDATTRLLRALATWDRARQSLGDIGAAGPRIDTLLPLLATVKQRPSQLIVFGGSDTAQELVREITELRVLADRSQGLPCTTSVTTPHGDPWADFLARPAVYFSMLAELGLVTEDEDSVVGDLPSEIIEAITNFRLDTTHLTGSLRGYQHFGARFALVQKKVVIGDEMGLGKTFESLAVLTHLRAKGHHHFLVICPAAVVTNWMREVRDKTKLRAHRIHGTDRERAAQTWLRDGGVAVTTFETLGWFERTLMGVRDRVSAVVVDEAHYIKNPSSQRSKRTARAIDGSEHAILLTGTPLENRIEEFRNLVRYLRPDLVVDAEEFAPRKFRRQVAPAYLRRNQEDVLTELPELVEVDEWLAASPADERLYRSAVRNGNFQQMRQSGMLSGPDSAKVTRMREIVEEARENGRRVLVFSHFRSVLDEAARHLPGKVLGPLTGSVPAAKRQQLVDDFSKAPAGSVLVSQIVAGGVGLNIQAASVVVICEPQVKPTTEWQAIARARRMGQLESVQVHRLLHDEGVDVRMTEILAKKAELFADFARVSETAQSTPDAFDITEAELATQVVAEERERLFKGKVTETMPDTTDG